MHKQHKQTRINSLKSAGAGEATAAGLAPGDAGGAGDGDDDGDDGAGDGASETKKRKRRGAARPGRQQSTREAKARGEPTPDADGAGPTR